MFDNKDKIIKVFYETRDWLLKKAIEKASLVNYDYVKIEQFVDDSLLVAINAKISKATDDLKKYQIQRWFELTIYGLISYEAYKVNEKYRKARIEKQIKYYYKNRDEILKKIRARNDFKKNSKVCNKCEVRKVNSDFSKSKEHAGGRRNICKSCSSKYHKNYTRDYGINKKYYLKRREWKIENKERNIKKNRTWERKRKSEMMNSYLRRLLTMQGIQKEWITPELLDIKKTILQIKRKIKQNGKDKNQKVNQQPT